MYQNYGKLMNNKGEKYKWDCGALIREETNVQCSMFNTQYSTKYSRISIEL